MEKTNDTMTICTLARPDVITLPVSEYKEHVMRQAHYELMLQTFLDALRLDSEGHVDIDYKGRTRLIIGLEIIETKALNYRKKQLRAKAVNGGE